MEVDCMTSLGMTIAYLCSIDTLMNTVFMRNILQKCSKYFFLVMKYFLEVDHHICW